MTGHQNPCAAFRVAATRRSPACGWTRRPVVAWIIGLAGLLVGASGVGPAAVPSALPAASPAALRIAIAPFEGERSEEPVSQLLSSRFAQLGVSRVLAPGSFPAERAFDPRAEQVRGWARESAVDSIVVGRVVGDANEDPREIEAVVRSGHSGAELFRHAVRISQRAELGASLDRLAAAIVRDLGEDPLVEPVVLESAPPPVSARAEEARVARAEDEPAAAAAEEKTAGAATGATTKEKEAVDAGGGAERRASEAEGKSPSGGGIQTSGGLDTRLGITKFQTDAPIEIQADAAEITAVGDDRKLIFQGGVRVKQDNVTLTSEWLEAEYVDGASEPSRLLAKGAVHVQQNDRAARCDHAEYLRSTQQITCRGHAELMQGCDVVRGASIVLDLAADRARVEGAASIVINPKPRDGGGCVTPGSRP